MSTLSENIARLRQSKHLSQKELANLLGVRISAVSNYETGYSSPKQPLLIRLADIFGVSVDALLGHHVPEEPAEPPFQVVPIIGSITSPDPFFPKESVLGEFYLPIESGRRQDYFGYMATDESMNLARVMPGDILLVLRTSHVQSGDLVLSFSEGAPKVRRYIKSPTHAILRPESTSSAYLPIPAEGAVILGKVTRGIIRL